MTVGPVVAFAPDLMDRSRIAAAVPGARFVADPAELAGAPEATVVVDLSRPGALEAVESLGGRTVVGFTSHTATDVLDRAARAGCRALPRSRFFGDVAAALA